MMVFLKQSGWLMTFAFTLMTLVVALAFMSPVQVAANDALFSTVQSLQQQIQVIEDAIADSEEITFSERQALTADLDELKAALSELQLSLGDEGDVRTNIVSLEIAGDLRDSTLEAVIRYDEEFINGVLQSAATVTLDYAFSSVYPDVDLKARAREMRTFAYSAIATDTELPVSMIQKLAQMSFNAFTDQEAVVNFFGVNRVDLAENIFRQEDHDKKSNDLLSLFGRYSVIEEINVIAGSNIVSEIGQVGGRGVSVEINSDQAETLKLEAITPCRLVSEGATLQCDNDSYKYTITYSVYGIPVLIEDDLPPGNAYNAYTLVDGFLYKSGIGKAFFGETDHTLDLDELNWETRLLGLGINMSKLVETSNNPTSDNVIAYYLTHFVTQQQAYLQLDARSMLSSGSFMEGALPNSLSSSDSAELTELGVPGACIDDRVEAAVAALFEYFITGRMQLAAPVYQLLNSYVPVVYVNAGRENISTGCMVATTNERNGIRSTNSLSVNQSQFFPGLPVVDWEAAIEEANPDTSIPWFLE